MASTPCPPRRTEAASDIQFTWRGELRQLPGPLHLRGFSQRIIALLQKWPKWQTAAVQLDEADDVFLEKRNGTQGHKANRNTL